MKDFKFDYTAGKVAAEVDTVRRGIRKLALLSPVFSEGNEAAAFYTGLVHRYSAVKAGAFATLPVMFVATVLKPSGHIAFICYATDSAASATELGSRLAGNLPKDFKRIGELLGYAPEICGVMNP